MTADRVAQVVRKGRTSPRTAGTQERSESERAWTALRARDRGIRAWCVSRRHIRNEGVGGAGSPRPRRGAFCVLAEDVGMDSRDRDEICKEVRWRLGTNPHMADGMVAFWLPACWRRVALHGTFRPVVSRARAPCKLGAPSPYEGQPLLPPRQAGCSDRPTAGRRGAPAQPSCSSKSSLATETRENGLAPSCLQRGRPSSKPGYTQERSAREPPAANGVEQTCSNEHGSARCLRGER